MHQGPAQTGYGLGKNAMRSITETQLRSLIQEGSAPCVSIFMPTHRQGRDVRQDPARLKNLLNEAEQGLVAHEMRATEARDMLEPLRKLVDDPEFWLHNEGGLAAFVCKGFHQVHRLPVEVDDVCTVNDRFDIKPLLPLVEGKLFYVLAVSLGGSRLLECNPHSCRLVTLPEDVALSFDDAIQGEEEHQTQLMRHQGATNVANNGPGAYHGQSATEKRSVDEDQAFFYRQLDEGVRRVMQHEDAPVVLAGTDSVVPFFRKASSIRNLAEGTVLGSPQHVPNETLHDRAMEILQPVWKERLNADQDRFGAACSKDMASTSLEDIVPSSVMGRIDTLFVAPRNSRWGRFHEEDQRVEVHNERGEGDIDLIDRAASQTLMTGGRVIVCEPEEVPGNQEIAAIYRF